MNVAAVAVAHVTPGITSIVVAAVEVVKEVGNCLKKQGITCVSRNFLGFLEVGVGSEIVGDSSGLRNLSRS